MDIIFVVLIFVAVACLGYLIYSAVKPKESTREQYAFKCLAAIVVLASLLIKTLSSKQGVIDQVVSLVAKIFGVVLAPPDPVPVSEQILMVIFTGFVVFLIFRSHENWEGAISSDEEDRRRMKRSTGLLHQALDESLRIIKHAPKRKLYEKDNRLDPVLIPSEPNLVWHDHVRELFELWFPSASFVKNSEVSWSPRERCWRGKDRIKKSPIFLFCIGEEPSDTDLIRYSQYAEPTTSAIAAIYVVVKAPQKGALYGISRIGFENIIILSEEFLYENMVDFSDYYADVARRVENDFFADTSVSIKDIYTPSSVSSDAAGDSVVSDDFGAYLAEWSARPAGKQIAVMGEYGQGKSTGALMFVYDSINADLSRSGGRIPILLELRGKSPANLSPPELLAAWAQQYQLQAPALMKLLIAGRLVIIFEGFDEMANVASVETRVSHFRSLWRFAFPKSKIIFTGRRNLFFEDHELQVVFRGAAEDSSGQLCEVLHLCHFNETKIKESLRWVDERAANEILIAANSNYQIFDIVARPALLFIVASLWGELRSLLLQGEITSAHVIDRFVIHSYARQQQKESELGFMTLTLTERRYFHEGLAVYMASRGRTNQITAPDLRAAIERLYKAYPERAHISDAILLETDRPALRIRYPDGDEAIESVLTDVRTHGILVNDLGQRGSFRFAHKSFYEMLAAKVQAHSMLNLEPAFYGAIKEAMDGVIDSVRTKSPEILSFFSEFFFYQLRQIKGVDVSLAAFDLLVGANKPVGVSRAVRLWAVRSMHNKIFKRCIFASAVLMAATGFVLNGYGRSFFGIEPKIENVNSLAVSSWVGQLLAVALAVLYFGLTWYSAYSSTRLMMRARLWVAVLISSDNSTRSTNGADAVLRLLGRGPGRELVVKSCISYFVIPFNSPDLFDAVDKELDRRMK